MNPYDDLYLSPAKAHELGRRAVASGRASSYRVFQRRQRNGDRSIDIGWSLVLTQRRHNSATCAKQARPLTLPNMMQ